jgi:hypothetical protein
MSPKNRGYDDGPGDNADQGAAGGGERASGRAAGSPQVSIEELFRLLASTGQLPVLPIAIRNAPFPSEENKALMTRLNDRLVGFAQVPVPRSDPGDRCMSPISVAFPPCSDVLLSLVRATETDEITGYFNDYFKFCDHSIVADQRAFSRIDPDLLACTGKHVQGLPPSPCFSQIEVTRGATPSQVNGKFCTDFPFVQPFPAAWPPPWCLPPSCTTLSGKRHLYSKADQTPVGPISRLFIGDLVWLFYFERMGIFKILGVILDDYARTGKLPLSNRNGIVPLVMESMTRVIQQGVSSRVSDRAAAYRRCLGWNSDVGRKLPLDTTVNSAFNKEFHRFIQTASAFYEKKQVVAAIQATQVPGRASVATLVTVSDTIDVLKKSFDPFDYGRNYSNTLSGIVWVIAGIALIREIRATLGIPPEFEQPYEFIPAAYDLLVLKRPPTSSETNRYTLHRECANDARDILMDIEVLNHQDNGAGGELEVWLEIIEDKVEGYRTAYRALTGVDLGTPTTSGLPAIEQQA